MARNEFVQIDSSYINNVTFPQAIDLTAELATQDYASTVVNPNADHLRMLRRNPELRQAYRNAALSFADGTPVLWAAALQGTPLQERVAGSDLEPALCERMQAVGGSVLYIGGKTPDVTEAAVNNRQAQFPDLAIDGITPSFIYDTDEAESRDIVDGVNRWADRNPGPLVVLVCTSAPRSVIWADKHVQWANQQPGSRESIISRGAVISVGGAIDFAAGTATRASERMQNNGLEWLDRLAKDPRRLIGRYARDAVFVAGLMYRSAQKGRQATSPELTVVPPADLGEQEAA